MHGEHHVKLKQLTNKWDWFLLLYNEKKNKTKQNKEHKTPHILLKKYFSSDMVKNATK